MTENHFIGIYWGARKETLSECVIKVDRTLSYLYELDASFKYWYSINRPPKREALMPLDLGRNSLNLLLNRGQNYNGEGELIEDLGYKLYLKSGENYSKAHLLSFACSGHSKVSKSIPNNVNLKIRAAMIKNLYFNQRDIQSIYTKLYEIWEPEEGVVREDK